MQATTAAATTRVRGSLVVPVASVPNTRWPASTIWAWLQIPFLQGAVAPGVRGGKAVYSAGGRPRTHSDSAGHRAWSFCQWGGGEGPRPRHHWHSSRTCRRSASLWHRGHLRLAPLAVVKKPPCHTMRKAVRWLGRFACDLVSLLGTVQSTPLMVPVPASCWEIRRLAADWSSRLSPSLT